MLGEVYRSFISSLYAARFAYSNYGIMLVTASASSLGVVQLASHMDRLSYFSILYVSVGSYFKINHGHFPASTTPRTHHP
jgi:hypothetical protein